jgi:hypothetical protein
MNELLNYFFHGSCGALKKSMRSGIDVFTLLFIFLCLLFSIGKMIATAILVLIKKLKSFFDKSVVKK